MKTMVENPHGISMVLHELTALVASFDQYRGGKGADRQFYLQNYDGDEIIKDRVGHEYNEPVTTPAPFMAIAGAMPPAMLPTIYGKGNQDGMMERFIYTYTDPRPRLRPDDRGEVPDELRQHWEAVGERLFAREMRDHHETGLKVPHVIKFSDAGRAGSTR